MLLRAAGTALALIVAAPALAETGAANRALVIGNESYARAAPIRLGAAVRAASAALADAGFRVLTGADMEATAMRERLALVLAETPAPERLVIMLAGHFAQSGSQTWFLGTDADRPSLATADGMALPLSTVLEIAAASPGGAVVLLGTQTRRVALGSGLAPGIGSLDPPQGVTVISGDAGRIVDFAEAALAAPGRSLPDLLTDWPDLQADGFLSPLVAFVPEGLEPGFEVSEDDTAEAEELAAWEAALAADTIEGFEGYLARFPDGRFAGEAREAIERIATDPERVETALDLTREQRREIQRHLTLLGFNTRGIDGIFGPGTRGAIRGWQEGRGLETTGFLNAAQIALLEQDAALRAAEIAEEERRQQELAEQADRDFWRDTGQGADEAGLRAYLARYPDGLFADVARARLAEIEAGRDREAWNLARGVDTVEAYTRYLRDYPNGLFAADARARIAELDAARDRAAWDVARAADTPAAYRRYLEDFPQGGFADRARARLAEFDRAAWDTARSADTVAAYRQYLADFPDGTFVEAAQARIDALEGADDEAAARAEEDALNLNFLARNLIEVQLRNLGFDPGRIDGRFDADTRRAIRRYQRNRDLPVTGYVSRAMLARMISEGLPLSL